jgi:hypothetical protein
LREQGSGNVQHNGIAGFFLQLSVISYRVMVNHWYGLEWVTYKAECELKGE